MAEKASTTEATSKRFIPFRRPDVVRMCLAEGRLDGPDRQVFEDFCRLLSATFHYEFHARLERLKEDYAPFNPDLDTRPIAQPSPAERKTRHRDLVRALNEILDAANFDPITEVDLRQSLVAESLFRIRVEVDFEEFEDVLFFRRGESRQRETVTSWFGLRRREIEFTNYDRVLVYIRFKPATWFADRNRAPETFQPGSTVIKLFQNVPRSDLEMLFPNTKIRMKPVDKLRIGIPAVVSGAMIVSTKLGGTLLLCGALIAFWLGLRSEPVVLDQAALVALGLGLAALAGYLWKQLNKFKDHKIRFMKTLTENLYFKNLDNNAGVFRYLIDAAEDEECKEAILAYFFLLTGGPVDNPQALDRRIESWFRTRWHCELDFDIGDALTKLERLDLLEREGEGYRARSLRQARVGLDRAWDGVFEYAGIQRATADA